MNRKVLALLVPALLVAGAANAAEVYNKMATNSTCTAKLMVCVTSLTMQATTATSPTPVLALKAKRRLTIC